MSTRHKESERTAASAAFLARQQLRLEKFSEVPVGIMLGTGWGAALSPYISREMLLCDSRAFQDFGISSLPALSGHKRKLALGRYEKTTFLALQGRIHLNEEPTGLRTYQLARLQVEMLIQMGVKTLILTNAVGTLSEYFPVGSVMIPNSFMTLFAGAMPLWGGEFCSPEDAIDIDLARSAMRTASKDVKAGLGTYAMVRGPHFESRRADKDILRKLGASAVGMSLIPESCIAALYGVKVLCLSFVTNDDEEKHSHEENLARAKEAEPKLSNILRTIVGDLR